MPETPGIPCTRRQGADSAGLPEWRANRILGDVAMSSSLDREALRMEVRSWSDHHQRLALERVVEQIPDAMLEQLLRGLAQLNRVDAKAELRAPCLRRRVEAHVAATRSREFLGEFVQRNEWGDREPWQTAAWLAATSHLFDMLFERVHEDGDAEAQVGLREMVALIHEVDDRCDEFIVFEEGGARSQFGPELDRSDRFLARASPEIPDSR